MKKFKNAVIMEEAEYEEKVQKPILLLEEIRWQVDNYIDTDPEKLINFLKENVRGK